MAFGEHKGKPISEVPSEYLKWCLANFEDSKRRTLLQIELERRERVDAYREGRPEPDQMSQHAGKEQTQARRHASTSSRSTRDADTDEASTRKCCQCRTEMSAVCLYADWCDRCGSVWLYNTKEFKTPNQSKPLPKVKPEAAKEPEVFRIPCGKYRGKTLDELDTSTLECVWGGFNGGKKKHIAAVLRAELDRRKKPSRKKSIPDEYADAVESLTRTLADTEESLPITPEECPF
jgi:uncharacterized protein (DUF3820 family)